MYVSTALNNSSRLKSIGSLHQISTSSPAKNNISVDNNSYTFRIEINLDVRNALQDENWASSACMQGTEKDFNLTEGEPPSDKGQPRPPDMFKTIRHSKIGYNA
jgi:hypothetical protein